LGAEAEFVSPTPNEKPRVVGILFTQRERATRRAEGFQQTDTSSIQEDIVSRADWF